MFSHVYEHLGVLIRLFYTLDIPGSNVPTFRDARVLDGATYKEVGPNILPLLASVMLKGCDLDGIFVEEFIGKVAKEIADATRKPEEPFVERKAVRDARGSKSADGGTTH